MIFVLIHDPESELSVHVLSCQGGWPTGSGDDSGDVVQRWWYGVCTFLCYLRPPQIDVSCSPHVSCSQVWYKFHLLLPLSFPAPVDHLSVVQLRAVFIEVGVHEEFIFWVSSGVSTVALFAWVAKSETEHIDRVVKPLLALLNKTLHSGGPEDHFSSMLQDVVSEASALAAWDIAKKYHAKDLFVPVSAPNSAEASVALFSTIGFPSTSFHAQARSMG